MALKGSQGVHSFMIKRKAEFEYCDVYFPNKSEWVPVLESSRISTSSLI